MSLRSGLELLPSHHERDPLAQRGFGEFFDGRVIVSAGGGERERPLPDHIGSPHGASLWGRQSAGKADQPSRRSAYQAIAGVDTGSSRTDAHGTHTNAAWARGRLRR